MLLAKHLLLLLSTSFLATVQAQRQIGVAGYLVDTSSCVDPSGIDSCSSHALSVWSYTTSLCAAGDQTCRTSAQITFERDKLYCLIQGCWNLAPGCDFQLAIAAYLKFTVVTESLPQPVIPFYYTADIRSTVPGACACNIARLFHLSYGASNATSCIGSDTADACYCCVFSQVVSAYYELCPSNDLTPVDALAQRINGAIQDVDEISDDHCAFLNNQAAASATCAAQEATVSGPAGYLNPATLPAGFPGTAPLSDLPGTVTALSQIGVTATTTVVVDGFSISTNTLTFAKATLAAASATGAASTAASIAASTAASGAASTAAPVAATVVPASSPQAVTLSRTGTNSGLIVTPASSVAALSSAVASQASQASSSAATSHASTGASTGGSTGVAVSSTVPAGGAATTSASAVATSARSASPAMRISRGWACWVGLFIAVLVM